MRKVLFILMLTVLGLNAQVHLVKNAAELNALSNKLSPGDTVLMKNGIWLDQNIEFIGYGAEGDSIVIKAESPGQVILTGSSRLEFSGAYVKVDGLRFTAANSELDDEPIEFRTSSSNLAQHCRLTNTSIVNYNPPSKTLEFKWVSIYGKNNRVDHCYFENKVNDGTTLVVWLQDNGDSVNHRIDHNYFGYRPELGFNGGETIRIGTSARSMTSARCTVEYNYFERCNGELEIISNKSCDNIYRYNTFVECEGVLTLRHGNRCLVEGNFFFGNNKTNTGGVRIIGEDHIVINNYFVDLKGEGWRGALPMMNGVPNSPLNRYFQVKNPVVAFNTFVNCNETFVFGYGQDSELSLPPIDGTIANNLVLSTNPVITIVDEPENFTWEGNIFQGSELGMEIPSGVTIADPKLELASDNLWRPATGSPAIGSAVGTYDYVTDDMDGHSRPEIKDAGADQVSTSPVLRKPVSKDNTGPDWLGTDVPVGLSVETNGNGSVILNPEGGVYDPGTEVTLTAVAGDASTFTNWTGDVFSSDNPLTITIEEYMTVVANFKDPNYYKISLWISEGGTVELDPEKDQYPEGEKVAIKAVPSGSYYFSHWSGSISGTENPDTIIMNANKILAPVFKPLTSVEEIDIIEDYTLKQNYPNPFNPSTKISFAVPETSTITLRIVSLEGKIVKELIKKETRTAGLHTFVWDGKNNSGAGVPSGIYFCNLICKSESGQIFTDTKKMTLLK